MNQTVWKYSSGDKKSIFGRPYTYNGSKWVPDEGVKTDSKGKEKVGANVTPKEADKFLKENGLEHIDMLSTKSVRKLFEHHGVDWQNITPKERLNELIKIYGTGSGTKPKEEKPKEEKPKEEKPKISKEAEQVHAKVLDASKKGVTDDPVYNELALRSISKLNPDSILAIRDYAEDSFFLNDTLRKNMSLPDEAKEKKDIALLDKAFAQTEPLSIPIDVHRATILPKEVFSKLSVGSGYKDKGFASTSTDKEVTQDFYQVAQDNKENESDMICQMKIHLPKGSKVLPIAPIAEELGYGFQKEILINRSSMYKVSRIKATGDQAIIHLELIT